MFKRFNQYILIYCLDEDDYRSDEDDQPESGSKHSKKHQVGRPFLFPVWPRNRFISAGLEPVPINTTQSCTVSY